jgi:hypothetical protein
MWLAAWTQGGAHLRPGMSDQVAAVEAEPEQESEVQHRMVAEYGDPLQRERVAPGRGTPAGQDDGPGIARSFHARPHTRVIFPVWVRECVDRYPRQSGQVGSPRGYLVRESVVLKQQKVRVRTGVMAYFPACVGQPLDGFARGQGRHLAARFRS